jgi:hypothetical protein
LFPEYRPHPNNALLKKEKTGGTTRTVIPTLIDGLNINLLMTSDDAKEESRQVHSYLNAVCKRLYENYLEQCYGNDIHEIYVKNKCPSSEITEYINKSQISCNIPFNSAVHRGLAIEVLGSVNNRWIDIIGFQFDPKSIKKLYGSDCSDLSLYINGFYTNEVRNICDYCQRMFKISRYEIATYFEKREPIYFLQMADKEQDWLKKRNLLRKVGMIYAENNDMDKAMNYFIETDEMTTKNDKRNSWPKFASELKVYVEKNKTSILFSEL